MKTIANRLGPYAKAAVLLVLIAAAGVADAAGVAVELDTEHYVSLLVADFMVWLVPNRPPIRANGDH